MPTRRKRPARKPRRLPPGLISSRSSPTLPSNVKFAPFVFRLAPKPPWKRLATAHGLAPIAAPSKIQATFQRIVRGRCPKRAPLHRWPARRVSELAVKPPTQRAEPENRPMNQRTRSASGHRAARRVKLIRAVTGIECASVHDVQWREAGWRGRSRQTSPVR